MEDWKPGMSSPTRVDRSGNARLAVPLAEAPFPIVAEVLAAESELGRDMNGQTLYAERIAWLNEQNIEDRDERSLMMRLFNVSSQVRIEVRLDEQKAARSK